MYWVDKQFTVCPPRPGVVVNIGNLHILSEQTYAARPFVIIAKRRQRKSKATKEKKTAKKTIQSKRHTATDNNNENARAEAINYRNIYLIAHPGGTE